MRDLEREMSDYVLISAVGPDRTGIVDDLSAFLSDRGFNIEKSRMAVLGGEFAILALVSGETEAARALVEDASALEKATGLTVFSKNTRGPSERQGPASLPYRLEVSGMDHPGIVHHVSKVLVRHKVNVEAMDTKVTPAPVSGAPVFTLEARLSIPAEVRIRRLKEDLFELAEDRNVDVELEHES